MNAPRLISAAAAFPRHRYSQSEIRTALLDRWADIDPADLRLLDRAGVRTRHLCFPLDYYFAGHGFARRNRDWAEQGLELAERAVADALAAADVPPDRVGHLFFFTTTGLATPSLDALLAERMELPRRMLRTPIFGIGCAGGAVGLSRAADWLRSRPDGIAVLLSVELCGQTFRPGDRSKTNLVGTALFGDGAAAAVLAGADAAAGRGLAVEASESELLPASAHLMGWDFGDDGFGLVLSPEVPGAVREAVAPRLLDFLRRAGLSVPDVAHWVVHPGGPKVLAAYRNALGLAPDALEPTRSVLASRGNVSSATVLVALADLLAGGRVRPGDPVLVTGVGPGFAVENVLLRG